MAIHILKLCVGCDSIDELAAWQRQRLAALLRADPKAELMHVTRQTPRREGIGEGSSIYWVIAGLIRARQGITGLREVRGTDGIARCGIALNPAIVATEPVPRRPFQGWRYLTAGEAPPDLDPNAPKFDVGMPPEMRMALTELRLI